MMRTEGGAHLFLGPGSPSSREEEDQKNALLVALLSGDELLHI